MAQWLGAPAILAEDLGSQKARWSAHKPVTPVSEGLEPSDLCGHMSSTCTHHDTQTFISNDSRQADPNSKGLLHR